MGLLDEPFDRLLSDVTGKAVPRCKFLHNFDTSFEVLTVTKWLGSINERSDPRDPVFLGNETVEICIVTCESILSIYLQSV